MKHKCLFFLFLCSVIFKAKCLSSDTSGDSTAFSTSTENEGSEYSSDQRDKLSLITDKKGQEKNQDLEDPKICWLKMNERQYFENMDKVDEKYEQARREFERAMNTTHIDKQMLEMMIQSRAAAQRAILNAGSPNLIPAGINFGGYGMIRLTNTVLFFHRVKLRNETRFKVNYLNNDIYNMELSARLSLNDLHLLGSYERALADTTPGTLFYRPTYGEAELLFKDVTYKMVGRYRLLQDRLVIEHVLSEIRFKDVMMMYRANGSMNCQTPEPLDATATASFVEQIKADLDSWLKDYFNDYLMYFELGGAAASKEIHDYDKAKAVALNEYVENAIALLKKRLRELDPPASNVKAPSFELYSVTGFQISLHSGVIRGMDSFFRHSVATGRKEGPVRIIDAVLGFSRLKMEYKYKAIVDSKLPPMRGLIILSPEELMWRMSISMIKDPESVNLVFNYLRQLSPQSLVISGPLNRMVSSYKHMLEDQIITLMMNTLYHHINQLASLTRCKPSLIGHLDPGEEPNEIDHKSLKDKGLDYAVFKNDSLEIEIPGVDGELPRKMHIKYDEKFVVSEIKRQSESERHGLRNSLIERRSKHHSNKKHKKSKKRNKHKNKKHAHH